jgi:1,4-alpha-glucan branching enzyme
MPGDRWQKFANLRAYLGFMFAHPGKKLLFMGCEFAQEREWNHDQSLDWHLLENENSQNTNKPEHTGVQRLVRDLNYWYRQTPALHQSDCSPDGFQWIDHSHTQESVFSFIRRANRSSDLVENDFAVIVCHFVPTVVTNYRIGVPQAGTYHERLNTDSTYYGGSNQGTPFGCATAEPVPWNGQPFSIVVTLPPLAMVAWECD